MATVLSGATLRNGSLSLTSPAALFAAGEVGVWYDPSDLYTMFSDAAGTTPVTAVETAVGLILDKSKGGVGTNGVKRVNLLTYTEQFDNAAWTTAETVTANQTTAPDGTLSADLYQEATGSTGHTLYTNTPNPQITSGVSYSFSCYFKKGPGATAPDWIQVFPRAAGFAGTEYANFKISDGTLGNSSGVTASITSVGSGWYRCSFTVTATSTTATNTGINIAFCNNSGTATRSPSYTGVATANIYVWGADLRLASETSTLPTYQRITADWPSTMAGNHATQSTSASRPVLSARYNLLTKTEQFDDAAWTKTSVTASANTTGTTDPLGTNTAEKLLETATTNIHYIEQNATVVSGTEYTASVYFKKAGRTFARLRMGTATGGGTLLGNLVVDLNTGLSAVAFTGNSYTITDAGNGWYKLTLNANASGTTMNVMCSIYLDATTNSYAGNTANGIYVWGADLRVANDSAGLIPAYQRVNTSTDYDTVGFPMYLKFDGTDDSLLTGNVDFTGTNKMTVWSGVRKLNDTTRGVVFELGDYGTTQNTASILAPGADASASYRFGMGGSISVQIISSTSYVSPITNVLCSYGSIPDDDINLRINGVLNVSSTSNQGTGNFINTPIYIGRRTNSTLPFNGRMYGLVVRGASSTTGEIADTERWLNGRTRAY